MRLTDERTDLINDDGLDEMQKTYAYRLAFKCFKALYWTMFAISLFMLILAITIEKSVIFAYVAIAIELAASIVYIIFGAKASKIGALNPAFAKYMAKPSTIIGYILMVVIYMVWYGIEFAETGEMFYLYSGIYISIVAATFIILGFIAKKNNKVTEEIEEDE